MFSLLNRKLARDVLRMRGQILAILLVVASGVALLVTNFTAFQALETSQKDYYRRFQFADVFASVKRAPLSVIADIRALSGVRAAEARIVQDVALDVPDLNEPATGRVISLPKNAQTLLNRLYLRNGRFPVSDKPDEILISEGFAEANHLRAGSVVRAAINGRWRNLQIVGVALSPEYIYLIKPGDLFPDNRRFGVLWMDEGTLAAGFDMEGAFNSLALSLEGQANERGVIADVDRLLRRYGCTGAYGRKDQVSHTFVTDEIRQNRIFGMIMPGILLGLASFLISTLLVRLVHIQREQIGTLKAFGFSNRSIAMHYVKLALFVATLGWCVGVVTGAWWASLIGEMYRQFYRFPSLELSLETRTIVITYGVVALTAVAACMGAVRRATRLPPAEAMRPETPVSFRAGLLEYLGAVQWIPLSGRMVVRNIGRYPIKAALSALGIALGAAVLLVGYYFQDALQHLADLQFRKVQKGSDSVMFANPRNASALAEIATLPGVLGIEGVRIIPVRIWNGYRERRVGLVGLEQQSQLRRLVAQNGSERQVPPAGLVLTKKLAEILDVAEGGDVSVEALEDRRRSGTLRVAGVIDEALGLSAYSTIETANLFMLEDRLVSGAYLLTDPNLRDRLYVAMKSRPGIVGVTSRTAALRSFEDTLAKTSGSFGRIFLVFATLIVFAAIYNAGRIALSERARELASLCVLGFSRIEVAVLVIGEQLVLTVLAVPVGLSLGYFIAKWISWTYSLEMFRIPLVIYPESYFMTALSVLVSAALSAGVVYRRVVLLNLVAAIKTRD